MNEEKLTCSWCLSEDVPIDYISAVNVPCEDGEYAQLLICSNCLQTLLFEPIVEEAKK